MTRKCRESGLDIIKNVFIIDKISNLKKPFKKKCNKFPLSINPLHILHHFSLTFCFIFSEPFESKSFTPRFLQYYILYKAKNNSPITTVLLPNQEFNMQHILLSTKNIYDVHQDYNPCFLFHFTLPPVSLPSSLLLAFLNYCIIKCVSSFKKVLN